MTDFSVSISGWQEGDRIPERFCFGVFDAQNHVNLGQNVNPRVSWINAPHKTQSFVLLFVDPDVPSCGDDVNQQGKVVPATVT